MLCVFFADRSSWPRDPPSGLSDAESGANRGPTVARPQQPTPGVVPAWPLALSATAKDHDGTRLPGTSRTVASVTPAERTFMSDFLYPGNMTRRRRRRSDAQAIGSQGAAPGVMVRRALTIAPSVKRDAAGRPTFRHGKAASGVCRLASAGHAVRACRVADVFAVPKVWAVGEGLAAPAADAEPFVVRLEDADAAAVGVGLARVA